MGLVAAVRSERIKVRHTAFAAIHWIMPLLGAVLFFGYYMLYGNQNEYRKLNLMLEITATVFPVLISIVVGLNIVLEEKTSYFQSLLAVPKRETLLLAKLLVLYGAGGEALLFLFTMFGIGIGGLGLIEQLPVGTLLAAVLGMAFCNFVIYIFHLFLSLKFGLGVSLFWGAFESLQCILYSNIELCGIWRYIPFSWSVNWAHDILQDNFVSHAMEWGLIIALSFGILIVMLKWFSCWEGRKADI